MKTPIQIIRGVASFCFLILSFVSRSAEQNIERLLDRTLNEAMTCDGTYNSEFPVIAFSTRRFMQAMAVKRRLQNAYDCEKAQPVVDFDASRENTWRFCVLGLCINQKCSCPIDITGKHCEKYAKKCWLIYCFLICGSSQPILRCMCTPSFYGKKVQTNYYWYDEGLKRVFIKPPPRWIDDNLQQDDRRIVAELMSDLEDYHTGVGRYQSEYSQNGRGPAQEEYEAPEITIERTLYSRLIPPASHMANDRNEYLPHDDVSMDESFRPSPLEAEQEYRPDFPKDYGELHPQYFPGAQEKGKFDENHRKINQPDGSEVQYPDHDKPKQTGQLDYDNSIGEEQENGYSSPQEDEYEYYNQEYEEPDNLSTDMSACFILVVSGFFFYWSALKFM